jgi:hypothetical protein
MAVGQLAPSPQLINCPAPGAGFKTLPATININGQPVTVYARINNNVYNLYPNACGCGTVIKPSFLLLPGTDSQAGGSITYTFSTPVSNIQLACRHKMFQELIN